MPERLVHIRKSERWLAIYNPESGSVKQVWPAIRAALREAGLPFEEKQTRAPGHATQLARSASAEGYAGLVVAGGDGSINEVCTGLMDPSEGAPTLPVLLVGHGTGNDFLKLLPPRAAVHEQARYDWRKALKHLSHGAHTKLFDLARVVASGPSVSKLTHYVNSMSAGFAADGCRIFTKYIRKLGLGVVGYHLTALVTLLRYVERPTLHIWVDDVKVWEEPSTMVMVNSGRCYGGSHWITPRADPSDGLLDLVVFGDLTRRQISRLLPRFRKEMIDNDQTFERHVGRRFLIAAETPLPAEVDGELLAEEAVFTTISVEVLPRRLRVVVANGGSNE